MRWRVWLWPLVGILLCLPVIGCRQSGPALGRATGVVTMNGEPVPGVRVVFVPEGQGAPSYGVTNDNGEFRMYFGAHREGAVVGDHSVLIEAPEPQKDENGKPILADDAVRINKKYEQPGALSATVDPGHNRFEFELDP